jgi:hypothetical protein
MQNAGGTPITNVDTTNSRVGINTASPQKELEIRGDLFIPGIDSSFDCDGSSTSAKGSCDSISDGAVLVALDGDQLDFDNNGSADGYPLCTDNLAIPTIICLDNYEGDWDTAIDCDGSTTTNCGTCTSFPNDTTLVSMGDNKLDFFTNTSVDCDGTATAAAGTCETSPSSTFTAMGDDTLDMADDDVADGEYLCTDSLTAPTQIKDDNNDNCADGAGGSNVLLGTGAGATVKVTSYWKFYDTDADGFLDNGEDLYIAESGVADGQYLCTDSLTVPTKVCKDTDNDCSTATTGTRILGADCTNTTVKVTSAWGFVDSDTDTYMDLGEDLYIDNTDNSGVNKLRKWHNCAIGCDSNDTNLLGTNGATATYPVNDLWDASTYAWSTADIPNPKWSFKDDDADSLMDNGEDLYLDYPPYLVYYSTGSIKNVYDTNSSSPITFIKGTLVIH